MKINMADIYSDMSLRCTKLSMEDKIPLNMQDKIVMFENNLIKYTQKKIEIATVFDKTIANEEITDDLVSLLKLINKKIENRKLKTEVFDSYTHFLLHLSSGLQGWHIIWEEKFGDKDAIYTKNKEGKWDSLISYKKRPALETTLYTLELFRSGFYLENENNKENPKVLKR